MTFASCATALAALTACSSESRLWRLSPFSETGESTAERANLWPVAWFNREGGSLLWPLVDYDRHGFAVRPIVSRDRDDLDVLFPLSHFDTGTGEGWALNYYSVGGNRGVFPLANVSSRGGFSFVGPVYWSYACADQAGRTGYGGFFPLAHVNDTFGFVGPAWWERDSDSYGLFPLFTHGDFSWYGPVWYQGHGDDARWGVFPITGAGPSLAYVGPFWWSRDATDSSFGLFPLATKGEASWIGPAWWHAPKGGATDAWGLFPLAWSERDEHRESLTVLPLYHGSTDAEGSRRALLLPPTWWETTPTAERHFVLPFYGHTSAPGESFTFALPLFARTTHGDATHTFTLLGDRWSNGGEGARGSGLDVYPLYWSARNGERSRQMLLPLYYYKEAGDERLLLTPLGGRGWDASGGSSFVNVLGPVFHHSEGKVAGADVATTAVLWPLFERGRSGETTTTRAIPLFGLESTPTTTDSWQLAGLGRYVADGKSTSWRAFPFYARSDAAETPDPLFDLTLARSWSHGAESSSRLLPLWWASGDAKGAEKTALFGLGRWASTEHGSAWRFWPLASGSSDPAADGWIDELTLIRNERHRDGDTSHRVFPLYWGGTEDGKCEHVALLGLARVASSDRGSAWRLWPLASSTDAAGLDDWLDPLTLVGVHARPEKTHVHVGTSLLFDLDRFGDEKRSWNVRTLALMNVGHDERRPADPAALPPNWTERRDHAGFLFDWFLVENSVTVDREGTRHADAHWRLPLVHEYERTARGTEWDLFCWSVSRERSGSSDKLHVLGGYAFQKEKSGADESVHLLGYAYRSDTKGDTTRRDIFPAMTWDSAPDACRVSFLWKLFVYDRRGDKVGGNFLFIPWGDSPDDAPRTTEKDS